MELKKIIINGHTYSIKCADELYIDNSTIFAIKEAMNSNLHYGNNKKYYNNQENNWLNHAIVYQIPGCFNMEIITFIIGYGDDGLKIYNKRLFKASYEEEEK